MTVRKTSAFAAERKKPKHGTLDFYPTPAWVTEALFENVIGKINTEHRWWLCWEPACGEGHMSEVLLKHFSGVYSTDVKNYGYEKMWLVSNFITEDPDKRDKDGWVSISRPDWIITNPPFNLVNEFILRALDKATDGVAIFAKIQLLEGATRWRQIYSKTPPNIIAPFASRVTLYENEERDKGGQMAFAWYVWEKDGEDDKWNTEPPQIIWIPPRDKEDPRQKKMFDKKDAEK